MDYELATTPDGSRPVRTQQRVKRQWPYGFLCVCEWDFGILCEAYSYPLLGVIGAVADPTVRSNPTEP